jgi:hypothetical protein
MLVHRSIDLASKQGENQACAGEDHRGCGRIVAPREALQPCQLTTDN